MAIFMVLLSWHCLSESWHGMQYSTRWPATLRPS